MKKKLRLGILAATLLGISSLNYSNVLANESDSTNIINAPFSEENNVLSDDVLNLLTVEDYVTAYEIVEMDSEYWNLTEKEQDIYISEVYIKIARSKMDTISSFSLPAGYEALNAEEKRLVKLYPSQAAQVYVASKLAEERTYALFQNGIHNGNGDAFRHAYWNAEMATMLAGYGTGFNVNNGKASAKLWADAHENGSAGQPSLEKQMDLYNNDIGRSVVTKKMSSKSLEAAVLTKVDSGSCRRISGNSLIQTNSIR